MVQDRKNVGVPLTMVDYNIRPLRSSSTGGVEE